LVVGRVVGDAAGATWPSALALAARNDSKSATVMRAEDMMVSPVRMIGVRFDAGTAPRMIH
jgi:hypothetical protein